MLFESECLFPPKRPGGHVLPLVRQNAFSLGDHNQVSLCRILNTQYEVLTNIFDLTQEDRPRRTRSFYPHRPKDIVRLQKACAICLVDVSTFALFLRLNKLIPFFSVRLQ